MDGWADLFKHFLSSKLSSACLLVASAVLCFGPKYLDSVPEVPDGWRWVAFGILVFTASQCAWWCLTSTWRRIVKLAVAFWKICFPVRVAKLSADEKFVLAFAAAKGGHLNYSQVEHYAQWQAQPGAVVPGEVAVEVAISNLAKLGLVNPGFMGGCYLTDEGKRFVLAYLK